MNLASWVLVGGVAGIAAGAFFGDGCAILQPIGFAYVGLLEAAVYPYLICSLLHGLGSLQPAKAWRLFKCGVDLLRGGMGGDLRRPGRADPGDPARAARGHRCPPPAPSNRSRACSVC